jgi:hypothetical protein
MRVLIAVVIGSPFQKADGQDIVATKFKPFKVPETKEFSL